MDKEVRESYVRRFEGLIQRDFTTTKGEKKMTQRELEDKILGIAVQ